MKSSDRISAKKALKHQWYVKYFLDNKVEKNSLNGFLVLESLKDDWICVIWLNVNFFFLLINWKLHFFCGKCWQFALTSVMIRIFFAIYKTCFVIKEYISESIWNMLMANMNTKIVLLFHTYWYYNLHISRCQYKTWWYWRALFKNQYKTWHTWILHTIHIYNFHTFDVLYFIPYIFGRCHSTYVHIPIKAEKGFF